jgi:diguanylate cyclase (GGDEF)-like protein
MDVLIAHGSDRARQALAASLRDGAGVTLVEVADGLSARDRLMRADGPQVALVDWDLPGLDGRQVCRRVRDQREGAAPYIILMAAVAAGVDLAAAAHAGAHSFVFTPVSAEELRARVAFGLETHAAWTAVPTQAVTVAALHCKDPLTRLGDRAHTMQRLEEELARSRRERATLGVGILDVDGLGPVNARYGRETGDEVLREVARRLRATLRPYDVVGRLESDEFLIITPRTGELDIADALDRVRAAMSARPFVSGEEALAITVTVGGVNGSEENAEELVDLARPVLEEAKAAGGDKVVAGARVVLESVLTHQWSD